MRRKPAALALLLAAFAVLVAGCTETQPIVVRDHSYSCCSTADVGKTYYPGETLSLHWIVTKGSDGVGTTKAPQLSAQITGPFTKSTLKSLVGNSEIVIGSGVLHVTAANALHPVSRIHIPSNAVPGSYKFQFTTDDGNGNSVRGASYIKVGT